MTVTNLAIKYRTAVLAFTFLIVAGGLSAYVSIPKESTPSIEFPTIVVTTLYTGASPNDVEATVTQVIEQEIATINDIDEMRSTSSEGVSTIVIEFTPDVETNKAYREVNRAVDRAKPDLPDAVEDPLIDEINTEDFPVMTVNLASTYPLARLKEVAEDLQDEIEGIPSVLEADLIGGLTREVQVNVDLPSLKSHGLSFNDIITTIQNENANIPGGSIDVSRLNYLVRIDGQFSDPAAEIEDLVVKSSPTGASVYIRDVAEVIFGFKERTSYARLQTLKTQNDDGEYVESTETDGQMLQVISLNITKRPGTNILETASDVRRAIEEFDFPNGTAVTVTGDQSEDVRSLVTDLENNIISGLIFVVLVLLFFLGVRNATLVGIAIPLSMFVAFLYFGIAGYTLNFIILFSLIIALGMLVDNAIVIVENIYRFREKGHARLEAARLATAEVGGPVVASTATTVAAFAPMLFWPGVIGEFMGYMPLTLIITLASSLFIAIVINPVITGFFVKVEGEDYPEAYRRTRLARFTGVAAVALVGVIIAIANWRTALVLGTAVPVVYALHRWALAPIGRVFQRRGLPALVVRYRRFLDVVLQRDYDVRWAMFRNTFALGALAGGFVLAAAGGFVAAAAGLSPAMILLVPGGILFAIGAVATLLHTVESIYLGGRASIRGGLVLALIMGLALGISYLTGDLSLAQFRGLMAVPAAITAIGVAGAVLNRRQHLILTDNRARVLTGTIGGLFIILGLFVSAPTGQGFFPDTDPGQVQITLEAPQGTTLEASNEVAEEAERRIARVLQNNPRSKANIENILVNVGVGGDMMFGGGASSAETSRVSLNMVDYVARQESSPATLARLREQLEGISGVSIEFTEQQMGPPTGPPVNLEISGPDFDRIMEITREVKHRLTEGMESGELDGLVDVVDDLDAGRPEVRIDVDRTRAAQFGLSTRDIAQTVRTAIAGTEADTYRSGDDEYDITVRLQETDRQSLESLETLTVTNDQERQIPLTSVAAVEIGTGFGSITRIDQDRIVTVSGDAAPGYNGPEVVARVQAHLADYRDSLPTGYSLEYTGGNEEQQESFGFLFTALGIGVSLIFLIMIAQFNSVSAPFIIMVAVGMGLVGVLLGLITTRTPFNLFTFIGIIALAGIIVNNNIVLIDYIMQLRARGIPKIEAIVEGGATRLRPVLLTALTTILGLVPLTFGINIDFVGLLTELDPNFQFGSENTQFWGPMGTAIISGLTFATFLTLVIVPATYSVFDSLAGRVIGAFAGRRARPLVGRPGAE